jgi:hypothetical protein
MAAEVPPPPLAPAGEEDGKSPQLTQGAGIPPGSFCSPSLKEDFWECVSASHPHTPLEGEFKPSIEQTLCLT